MHFKAIASQNIQRILKYFQALEKRIAKKCAKDKDFAKVSGRFLRGSKAACTLGKFLKFSGVSWRIAAIPTLYVRRPQKSSLHFQIQKVQAAFWVCSANGAASAICSLPRGGGLGRGLLGRTANSGAGCFLRVGMAAIRHALSLNFPLPVRVCPLPREGMGAGCFEGFRQSLKRFCSGLKNEKAVRRHAHRFAESKI